MKNQLRLILLNGRNLGRINDVAFFGNSLLVGTEKGLFSLDKANHEASVINRNIFIEEIRALNKKYSPAESVTFDHDVGQISFTVKVINYRDHNDLEYQYRIDQGTWNSSSSNQIVFSDLNPGIHQIQFRSRTKKH